MTARAKIERAFHVSLKLPEQAVALLDEYRAECRHEAAQEQRAKQDAEDAAHVAQWGNLDHDNELVGYGVRTAADWIDPKVNP